jgi:hypothetical protein
MSTGKKDEQRNTAYDTRANTAIDRVQEVHPLENRIADITKRFFDYQEGVGEFAGRPKDVRDMPGMSDTFDSYANADLMANTERMGGGAMNLASPADSGFARQLQGLRQNQRYDIRARGLSDAARGVQDRAYGLANQTIDRQDARNRVGAGLELQNRAAIYGRPRQPNIWQQLAGPVASGLSLI